MFCCLVLDFKIQIRCAHQSVFFRQLKRIFNKFFRFDYYLLVTLIYNVQNMREILHTSRTKLNLKSRKTN